MAYAEESGVRKEGHRLIARGITAAKITVTFMLALILSNCRHTEAPHTEALQQWTATGLRGLAVMSLAVDPRNSQRLSAVTSNGIVQSSDGGATWQLAPSQLWPLRPECNLPELSQANPQIAYVVCQTMTDASPTMGASVSFAIYQSTDSGTHWTQTGKGPAEALGCLLKVDPTDAQRLYCITQHLLFVSTDGGQKWGARHEGLQGGYIAAFAFDPARPNTLYAGTYESAMGPSTTQRIFKSVNAGQQWTEIGTSHFSFSTVITAPHTPQSLYVSSHLGMMMSSDGGKSWQAGGLPPFAALVVDPHHPRMLYAGTHEGVFISDDGGESWTSINDGLTSTAVISLTLDPVDKQTLYVGTNDGVARLRLTGRWQPKVLAALESPAENDSVSGVGVLRGWAFATRPGVQIAQILPSTGRAFPLTCSVPRKDIQKAFPQFPSQQTLNSGWGEGIPWWTQGMGEQVARVAVRTSTGVLFYPKAHIIHVVRLGDADFFDKFIISAAHAEIVKHELVLENVVIHDAKSQRQMRIRAAFRWFPSSQSFGLTQVVSNGIDSSPVFSRPWSLGDALIALAKSLDFSTPVDAATTMRTYIESPNENQIVSGTGVIRGWAFSESRVAAIRKARLRVDGVLHGEIPCCLARPDVDTAFGIASGAAEWNGVILYGDLPPGPHTLEIQLEDSFGEVTTLERKVTVLRIGGFSFLDQFDLAQATVQIEGEEVLLKRVRIRDKESQKTKQVDLRLRWFAHSQSLGIVASSNYRSV